MAWSPLEGRIHIQNCMGSRGGYEMQETLNVEIQFFNLHSCCTS